MIEKANYIHLTDLAKCHRATFPNSLSSKLGMRFCKKMQEWFLVDPRGEILHATNEQGQIVGYVSLLRLSKPGCSGSFTSISTYAFTTLVLSFVLKPWLLFHKEIWVNRKTIGRVIKQKLVGAPFASESRVATPAKEFIPSLNVVGIGVIPSFQGSGYGSMLLQAVEKLAIEENFSRIGLSVNSNNKQAIKVYVRNGFAVGVEKPEAFCMEKIISVK